MINKLLFKLTNHLHCRCILSNGKPYLERYYITKNIFLHRFVSGDGDRHIHDHPWRWAFSLILLGSYIEELRNGPLVRRRWFNWIGPHYFHRIINAKPGTWTLFVHGKRVKGWGFYKGDEYRLAVGTRRMIEHKAYPLGRDSCYRFGFCLIK